MNDHIYFLLPCCRPISLYNKTELLAGTFWMARLIKKKKKIAFIARQLQEVIGLKYIFILQSIWVDTNLFTPLNNMNYQCFDREHLHIFKCVGYIRVNSVNFSCWPILEYRWSQRIRHKLKLGLSGLDQSSRNLKNGSRNLAWDQTAQTISQFGCRYLQCICLPVDVSEWKHKNILDVILVAFISKARED